VVRARLFPMADADEALRVRQQLKTLVLLASLPNMLLPALTQAASQKTYITSVAAQAVVTYCGHDYLARTLGRNRARGLQVRSAEREGLSGL
jgi:hypothetical protein